ESNHPGDAAVEFERIAASPTEDRAVRREAQLRSADLYEKAHNAPKMVASLEKFIADYPTPIADAMEARQRLADAAGRGADAAGREGNVARQLQWDREIVDTDARAGAARTDRTRFLAAKAQLALAEPARDSFRSIHLVAPLKKSLAAKRKSLEAALAAYKQA